MIDEKSGTKSAAPDAAVFPLWRRVLLYLLATFFIVSVIGQLRNIGYQDDISLIDNIISLSIRLAGLVVGIALFFRRKIAVYIFVVISVINPVWTYLFPKMGYVEEKYYEPVWLFFLFGFPAILIALMMVNWKYYK